MPAELEASLMLSYRPTGHDGVYMIIGRLEKCLATCHEYPIESTNTQTSMRRWREGILLVLHDTTSPWRGGEDTH